MPIPTSTKPRINYGYTDDTNIHDLIIKRVNKSQIKLALDGGEVFFLQVTKTTLEHTFKHWCQQRVVGTRYLELYF